MFVGRCARKLWLATAVIKNWQRCAKEKRGVDENSSIRECCWRAREGGQCRPETLEGHATRPKAATHTCGGPRSHAPVPYADFILTILGENSNRINGIELREYRFDLLNQFLSSPTSLSHHLVTLTITITRNVQILVPCALCGDRIVR